MSDNYTDDYDEFDEEANDNLPGLRRAANKAKKLEAENRSLKREIAFARAGIALDDPKMKYFVKGYDGEMEADAIKVAAIEAGFLASSPQAAAPAETPAEPVSIEGQDRVMAASAGAVTEDISEMAALSRMEDAMNEGGLEAMLDVARQYGIPTSYEV